MPFWEAQSTLCGALRSVIFWALRAPFEHHSPLTLCVVRAVLMRTASCHFQATAPGEMCFTSFEFRQKSGIFWVQNGGSISAFFCDQKHLSFRDERGALFGKSENASFRAHVKVLRAPQRVHAFCKHFKMHFFGGETTLTCASKGRQNRP